MMGRALSVPRTVSLFPLPSLPAASIHGQGSTKEDSAEETGLLRRRFVSSSRNLSYPTKRGTRDQPKEGLCGTLGVKSSEKHTNKKEFSHGYFHSFHSTIHEGKTDHLGM